MSPQTTNGVDIDLQCQVLVRNLGVLVKLNDFANAQLKLCVSSMSLYGLIPGLMSVFELLF